MSHSDSVANFSESVGKPAGGGGTGDFKADGSVPMTGDITTPGVILPDAGVPVDAVAAAGTVGASGTPGDGNTVTVNGRVYTFKTALTPANDEVLINGQDGSLTNLEHAINNSGGTPGTDYQVATANADVTASDVANSFITLTAIVKGVSGDSITLARVGANLSVSDATLGGGSDGTPGTENQIIANNGGLYVCTAAATIASAGIWQQFGMVRKKVVTLTDAQIKALPEANGAVELIPSPGNGKMVFPVGIMCSSSFADIYESIDANGYITFRYASTFEFGYISNDSGSSLTDLTTLLGNGQRIMRVHPYIEITSAASPRPTINTSGDVADQAFEIKAFNSPTGDFTGGNAANSLTVTIFYVVVDV